MKNIFIYSYSNKSKPKDLKKLKPWTSILDGFGCMTVSSIKEAYNNLVKDFTVDNLILMFDELDKYFKESKGSQIKSISEAIGKMDYKRISVEFDVVSGDFYVDYFLIDDDTLK